MCSHRGWGRCATVVSLAAGIHKKACPYFGRSAHFFSPRLFENALPPAILAVVFILVASIAIRFGFLRSLHSISRDAYGTVYYPLAFLILVLLFWDSHPEIVSLSMLALGLGDASAAIVGESLKNPKTYYLTTDKKSLEGSIAVFVTLSSVFWQDCYILTA